MNLLLRLINPRKSLLENQRRAAAVVTSVLKELEKCSKPETPVALLDEMAERMIRDEGCIPLSKGYTPEWAGGVPFPSTVCVSINEEACHGVPGDRILRDGDIVTYDLGVRYRDGCGDAALTVAVGNISNRKQRTMRAAKKALYEAIRTVKAGVPISEIGKAVDKVCNTYNMSVIREFGGHHIGKDMHEMPHIHHFYLPKNNSVILQEGAVICIEPILTPGNTALGLAPDKWTYFLLDGQSAAMFEHMVLVTKDGYEILTKHINEDHVT